MCTRLQPVNTTNKPLKKQTGSTWKPVGRADKKKRKGIIKTHPSSSNYITVRIPSSINSKQSSSYFQFSFLFNDHQRHPPPEFLDDPKFRQNRKRYKPSNKRDTARLSRSVAGARTARPQTVVDEGPSQCDEATDREWTERGSVVVLVIQMRAADN